MQLEPSFESSVFMLSCRLLQQIEARQRAQDKAHEALRRDIRAALRRERIALLQALSPLLHATDAAATAPQALFDSQVPPDHVSLPFTTQRLTLLSIA